MTPVLRYGLALAALALPGGPAASAPPAAREPVAVAIDPAAVAADGATTRLTLVLSRPVAATAFVLDRPDRMILDLPGTRCGFGGEERVRAGSVSALRCGGAGPGRSRLVLDLGVPAVPGAVRVGPGPVPGTSLLSVDLVRSDRDAFRQAAAIDPSDLVTTTASLPGGPLDDRPLLAIDAGHGGTDPGALGPDGTPEKDVTLAFATELHRQLLGTGRYRLLVIRPDDTFVPLDDRVKRARDAGARLFVSIHADQIANPQVGGATIYTGAERATDAESAGLAERENAADAAGGAVGAAPPGEIAGILHDLTIRETRHASQKASGLFLKELGGIARLSSHPRREAGFRVLRNPDLPSILVELGYMSNARDFDRLTSAEWRARTAGAMVAALGRFFDPATLRPGAPRRDAPRRDAPRTASAGRAPL